VKVNQAGTEAKTDTAKNVAGTVSRRQIVVRSAIALGGLAMMPMLALVSVCAESDIDHAGMRARLSQRDIDALSEASVLYIATVRRDGNQSTPAPVWFTISPNHLVLIQTEPITWKAKRIRRGSPVIVWIGKPRGPAFIGKAEITSDPAVPRQIVDDYPKRYLMARLGLHRPTQEMFEKGQILAISNHPVRDLPEGFASRPGTLAPSIDSERQRPTPLGSPDESLHDCC
jgi:hypothetical protein